MTNKTPAKAPFPVEDFMKFTAKEQSTSGLASCEQATTAPCHIPVHVGLFFDGTNNNMERDLNGRRVGLPDPVTKKPDPEKPLPNKPIKPEQCSHSNVVRLFRAFPDDKRASGYHGFYIPGVGTEFREIGEFTESAEGKAFAKGGYPRIIWGLFQVLNAIHRTVFGGNTPLYESGEVGELVQAYENEVGRKDETLSLYGQTKFVTHRSWFAPHLEKLGKAMKLKPKPAIPSLRLSVFGFSRGAAEAAAFCHFFNDLLDDGELIGIASDICFLGLFDVVASVGLPASVADTLPFPDAVVDGHWSWAKRILDPLPRCVKAGQHFIATHELRMSFPVTVMQGKVEEVYFPGVHADVGGSYAPGTQGKGYGTQAALLSQIPLAHMYKAARLAGVPLRPFSELEPRVKIDFKVDAGLASAWEAYTAALGENGHVLKRHMELYYRWRAARLDTLETTASFRAASAQEQQDLGESNWRLAGDLEAVRMRQNMPQSSATAAQSNPLHYSALKRMNQWHFWRTQNRWPVDEWEEFCLDVFAKREPLPAEVMRFFDNYVHDSFAGFYLAGELTEFDRRVKVDEVMRKNPRDLDGFEKKIHAITAKTRAAQDKKAAGDTLTPEEEALVDEAKSGTPYPIMTDQDSADMRKSIIKLQTDTRREGGGYIIRRGYFPHNGFLWWRKPIRENELQRMAAAHFLWSDNVRQDILARQGQHVASA